MNIKEYQIIINKLSVELRVLKKKILKFEFKIFKYSNIRKNVAISKKIN